ncbi:uncharacterized protein LACBIDRAFT_304663 [Laccaria bicolor S238N-H82]|uniref:Predicted protein n=1 Tax=Laccaria bicolor (strain S238N-H82 / ATCC MYA-4686) TaxID=486041 RepID=B0DM36_LACBS|nr:uncharacterized protein LACBIDRAFT_304663 [Laccaria bicolor S238N-H82]EDR04403.1 predicted protein [Laccaria bicolor S238N-H82]|eukprot:XP_001884922.1 predicted protein [Laccaria bicolor S238N-H82]
MCSNFGHSRSWIQLVRSFPLTPYGELAVSSEYTSYTVGWGPNDLSRYLTAT